MLRSSFKAAVLKETGAAGDARCLQPESPALRRTDADAVESFWLTDRCKGRSEEGSVVVHGWRACTCCIALAASMRCAGDAVFKNVSNQQNHGFFGCTARGFEALPLPLSREMGQV
jgi:hypothetical protein